MVTFVPAFVSQECADWLAGLKRRPGRAASTPGTWPASSPSGRSTRPLPPLPEATLAQVADHIEHVRDIAGIDHVGIGGDFDGTPDLPVGLRRRLPLPGAAAELVGRGWPEADCKALAGGNILRVLRAAEGCASRH